MSGKIAQQVKVPATTSGERIHSLIVIVCVFGVHTMPWHTMGGQRLTFQCQVSPPAGTRD